MRRLAMIMWVIAACSPPNVSNSDPNAACGDYAYARCTRLQQCSPTYVQFRYGISAMNLTLCVNVAKAQCLGELAAASIPPSTWEACAQVVPTWPCSDFIDSVNPPPQCAIQPGALANGAACAFARQCQSTYCAIAPNAACGSCAPEPKAGDSCAMSDCGLADGLTCEGATPICLPFANAGGACNTTGICDYGAGDNCASSTCQHGATTAGATCLPGGPGCAFVDGLVCNSATTQCKPIQFAPSGQPCGTIAYQAVSCSGGASCIGATSTTTGVCSDVSTLGNPCDTVNGPSCVAPTHCILTSDAGTSGTCKIPDASLCN